MELAGKLKENVDKAENREEAKKMIKNAGAEAGIILSEEELDEVSGGGGVAYGRRLSRYLSVKLVKLTMEGYIMKLTQRLQHPKYGKC